MAPVEDTALGEKGKNASFAIEGTILFFSLVWSFSLSIIMKHSCCISQYPNN